MAKRVLELLRRFAAAHVADSTVTYILPSNADCNASKADC